MSLMLADLFHTWKMNSTQLDVYYREKRKRENSQNVIVPNDDWRRRIHPLFIAALKVDRLKKNWLSLQITESYIKVGRFMLLLISAETMLSVVLK